MPVIPTEFLREYVTPLADGLGVLNVQQPQEKDPAEHIAEEKPYDVEDTKTFVENEVSYTSSIREYRNERLVFLICPPSWRNAC